MDLKILSGELDLPAQAWELDYTVYMPEKEAHT